MWRPLLPQRNPDRWLTILLMTGLPGVACLLNGVSVVETIVTAALIGGVLAIVH